MPTTKDLFTALRRRFEPLVSLALVTRARQAKTPLAAEDYTACARSMDRLAEREARLSPPEGLDQDELGAARLAAYTFVDELLLSLPNSTWFSHGLQLNRLGLADGGSRFYQVLGHLLDKAARLDSETILPEEPISLPRNTEASLASQMGNLARDMKACDCNPPLAAAAFLALCLVYGFRGELYSSDRQTQLEELLQAARQLLQRLAAAPDHAFNIAQTAVLPRGSRSVLGRFRKPGFLFLVLAPLVLTALWYLTCATLVNTMSLPWSGA